MTKHACPFNKKFKFEKHCSATQCPYHTDRATEFFNVEPKTKCMRLDLPDAVVALSEASLSSLDSTGYARHNHRRVRRDVDEALVLSRTIIQVLDDIPPDSYCPNCGISGAACSDKTLCQKRKEWVTKVANEKLRISSSANILVFANIWSKLQSNKLQLNDAVMERHGRRLLPA